MFMLSLNFLFCFYLVNWGRADAFSFTCTYIVFSLLTHIRIYGMNK